MTHFGLVISLLLASALLQACVLVPFPVVPEADQFSADQISSISPGDTSRIEVVERFGKPTVERQNGRIAVYGQARTVAGWFFGALWGSGGTMPIERKSMLLIEYNTEDIVSQVHVLHGDNSCTDSGLCVEAEFILNDTDGLMEHESNLENAVIYLTENEVQPKDGFDHGNQYCNVYLYSTGADEFVSVRNSEIGENTLVIRGYILWSSEPGSVAIEGSRRGEWSAISFDCPANALRFVNVSIDKSAHLSSPVITVDSEENGMATVLARLRLLH